MSDAPPTRRLPATPAPGGYQPPQPPPAPGYQPPTYQQPPAQPTYQQPAYQQPAQFQPVNPGASSSGNGCLKAFLIVGGISAVIGIIIVVAAVFLVGSAVNEVSRTFGVADAGDYTVAIDTCEIGDLGEMSATGTITNNADRRQAYNLTIDFVDADNSNLKLGSDSLTYTGGLDKGQATTWSVTSYATGEPTGIECKQGEVSYWPS